MEKVRKQIKQELQKQEDWANHWDSWEAWGEEIELQDETSLNWH